MNDVGGCKSRSFCTLFIHYTNQELVFSVLTSKQNIVACVVGGLRLARKNKERQFLSYLDFSILIVYKSQFTKQVRNS